MRVFPKLINLPRGAYSLRTINRFFSIEKQRERLLPAFAPNENVYKRPVSKAKRWIGALTVILMMFTLAESAMAQSARAITKDVQAMITPEKALEMLKEGNERFVKGKMINRDLMKLVSETSGGQYPYAVVLGCIDSRVPPELVFDQGIGDIFTPRIAGNFVNTDILGSMEFATKVAGSKLIVVLGHSSCGAVKGACDHVELGNLTNTLSNIMPAVYAVDEVIGERNSGNDAFVEDVAHMNVKMTVENILQRSPLMKEMVDNGELMVVGAMHDVSTGRVTFMD